MTTETEQDLQARIQQLEERLETADQTLRALRGGEVDALVGSGPGGDCVYTLKGADEVYRVMVQHMAEGALTVAADGLILFCNEQFANLLGIPLEQVVGSDLATFIEPQDRPMLSRVLACASGGSAELRLNKGTATPATAKFSASGQMLDGVAWVCLVVTDLTERKRAEEEIQRLNKQLSLTAEEEIRRLNQQLELRNRSLLRSNVELQQFAAVVQSSDDAIITKTLDGTITGWNRGAEKVFGYSSEEAMGNSIFLLIPTDRLSEEPEILARLARSESIPQFETIRLRKDGRRINVSVTISPIKDAGGAVVGVSKVARDVTERRLAEEEIQRLNQQLSLRNQSLERSNTELQQFAYIASHDLQSPLRSISGFVQLLKLEYGDKLDERADDWIRRTVNAVGKLQRLIHDLLAYSRVDSRGRPFVAISFKDIVAAAVALLESSIRESGAQVTCGDLPTVVGDSSLLVQLMQNLIGNALKYHGEKPPAIHVSAEWNRGEWIFTVQDNGIGISPKYYERIFEVFARLHDEKAYAGTGIGLAICRRVVDRHSGRIWVESELGSGSAFHFTLGEGGVTNK